MIALTGWWPAAVVALVAVAWMILPPTWTLLREVIDVLLEATPRNVDILAVRQHILDSPGVVDAHDLHAWTLTSVLPVLPGLSVRVVVADDALADGGGTRILDHLAVCLADHFDVAHCTFQVQPTGRAPYEFSAHE